MQILEDSGTIPVLPVLYTILVIPVSRTAASYYPKLVILEWTYTKLVILEWTYTKLVMLEWTYTKLVILEGTYTKLVILE